jgi:hypothetical protein
MAMTATLFTLNSLAVELSKDRRTIARALRHVRADGEIDGRRAWYLATAIDALNRVEGTRSNAGNGHDESDLVALESVGRQVQRLIDDLAALPNVAARRKLMQSGRGVVLGQLVTAFDRVESRRDANARMVSRPFIDMVLGQSITEVMHLCRWKIAS